MMLRKWNVFNDFRQMKTAIFYFSIFIPQNSAPLQIDSGVFDIDCSYNSKSKTFLIGIRLRTAFLFEFFNKYLL